MYFYKCSPLSHTTKKKKKEGETGPYCFSFINYHLKVYKFPGSVMNPKQQNGNDNRNPSNS